MSRVFELVEPLLPQLRGREAWCGSRPERTSPRHSWGCRKPLAAHPMPGPGRSQSEARKLRAVACTGSRLSARGWTPGRLHAVRSIRATCEGSMRVGAGRTHGRCESFGRYLTALHGQARQNPIKDCLLPAQPLAAGATPPRAPARPPGAAQPRRASPDAAPATRAAGRPRGACTPETSETRFRVRDPQGPAAPRVLSPPPAPRRTMAKKDAPKSKSKSDKPKKPLKAPDPRPAAEGPPPPPPPRARARAGALGATRAPPRRRASCCSPRRCGPRSRRTSRT